MSAEDKAVKTIADFFDDLFHIKQQRDLNQIKEAMLCVPGVVSVEQDTTDPDNIIITVLATPVINKIRVTLVVEPGEHPEDKAEREKLGLTEEQYDRRLDFERNCSCHISPPCWNCVTYSELYPESC